MIGDINNQKTLKRFVKQRLLTKIVKKRQNVCADGIIFNTITFDKFNIIYFDLWTPLLF